MTCEYFLTREGRPFCIAYGLLKAASSERVRECQTNYLDCLERAKKHLKVEWSESLPVLKQLETFAEEIRNRF